MDTEILVQQRGSGVYEILLNRPAKGNALTAKMLSQLTTVLNELALAADIRALIIAGTGHHFCVGTDLEWMKASIEMSEEENFKDAGLVNELLIAVDEFPVPVIAKVSGAVYGGGIGLVACADIVLAESSAHFRFSEVAIGLAPALISPYIVRSIGIRQAYRYMLTAEQFDVVTAHEINIVHEIVVPDVIDERCLTLAKLISANGPSAVRETKRLLKRLANRDHLLDEQPCNQALISNLRISTEGQEGLAAYFEKRSPAWADIKNYATFSRHSN